jgi:hypothetical protein
MNFTNVPAANPCKNDEMLSPMEDFLGSRTLEDDTQQPPSTLEEYNKGFTNETVSK